MIEINNNTNVKNNSPNKRKVAVIFGGQSSEYEVSLKSAAYILNTIDRNEFEITMIGITRSGSWLLYSGEIDDILNDTWHQSSTCKAALISCNRAYQGIYLPESDELKSIDIVFPVLHGKNGEDGRIQGLLELAGIPFVGCGMLASASGMDKHHTKLLAEEIGINQADYFVLRRQDFYEDKDGHAAEISDYFSERFPVFVKPCRSGSSVGISKVKQPDKMVDALELAFKEDRKVLIEQGIKGRELEVAVKGNRFIETTKIGEILANDGFYSYDEKYRNAKTITRFADDLSDAVVEELRATASRLYKTMSCRGLSRIDFFLTEDDIIYFNEINTMPGFTEISMYPMLWANEGIEGKELITQLIEYGLDKYSEDA